MAQRIDFYFDFSSPYGYLASTRIDEIGRRHGVEVRWRPFLLGIVMKLTGQAPLSTIPIKSDYFLHDIARTARRYDIPLAMPQEFPFGTVTACRAFYLIERRDPEAAKRLGHALFAEAFARQGNICPIESVAAVAAKAGFDAEEILAGIQTPEIKQHLKGVVDEAVGRRVFGSPMTFVDDEPFWGADRLDEVDRWLSKGGW